MFGFRKKDPAPPAFQILGFNHRLLRFTSTRKYELGHAMDLSLDIPGLGPTKVPITIVARDVYPENTFYSAEVLADLRVRQFLFAQFGTNDAEEDKVVEVPQEDRRCRPRFRTVCSARSRRLPGFQAMTWDLTPEGTRLQAREQMAPGEELEVEIDLDDTLVGVLKLRARVVWSSPGDGGKGAWIGLRFADQQDRAVEQLARYLERKVGR